MANSCASYPGAPPISSSSGRWCRSARDSASRRSLSSSPTRRLWTWFESWASTSLRGTTWASPSRSRRSGPRRAADPLQRDQEGLVGGAGRALQADLAGPVAAQVRVVLRAGQLGGLLGRGRRGELRV